MSLTSFALTFPSIDPIAIQIGPFAIRWYALAYLTGLLLAWQYCKWLAKQPPQRLRPIAFDDFLLWAMLGVVLGGRIGYVLFYKPGYYLEHPLEIAFIWRGGMSFHGGLLGVILAIYFFARVQKVHFFTLADIVAAATPIGLFLGRIANFINGELYGRVTTSPLGMVFPGGGPLPRHASQLYEAVLEGIVLFLVLLLMVRRGALERTGLISGVFLIGYALSRILVEFVREPDIHLGFLFGGITMGQLLSLPMLLLGIAIVIWSRRHADGQRQRA